MADQPPKTLREATAARLASIVQDREHPSPESLAAELWPTDDDRGRSGGSRIRRACALGFAELDKLEALATDLGYVVELRIYKPRAKRAGTVVVHAPIVADPKLVGELHEAIRQTHTTLARHEGCS